MMFCITYINLWLHRRRAPVAGGPGGVRHGAQGAGEPAAELLYVCQLPMYRVVHFYVMLLFIVCLLINVSFVRARRRAPL